MSTQWEKLQNAAHRLNAEAYAQRGAPRRRFTPCAKAEVLIEACGGERVLLEVLNEAAGTLCECHPGTTVDQLFDMCFDSSYRLRR